MNPVKGNIGSNGNIYHMPGWRSYNQTKPERCFATAADAEAAGVRAPKNGVAVVFGRIPVIRKPEWRPYVI
jgi:hypothetical protein